MQRPVTYACLSLAAIAMVGAPSKAAPVTGPIAWASLISNTIAGTSADGPYAEFFRPNGTVVLIDGEGREVGHWSLQGSALCLDFPTDPDEHAECRSIEVEDTHGAFIDSDGSRYPFDILPGDAKGLG